MGRQEERGPGRDVYDAPALTEAHEVQAGSIGTERQEPWPQLRAEDCGSGSAAFVFRQPLSRRDIPDLDRAVARAGREEPPVLTEGNLRCRPLAEWTGKISPDRPPARRQGRRVGHRGDGENLVC